MINKTNIVKISVKNFGPISEGEINLTPLTIFIGPNNSGKSYFSMLIYSLFESFIPSHSYQWFFSAPKRRLFRALDNLDISSLAKSLKK